MCIRRSEKRTNLFVILCHPTFLWISLKCYFLLFLRSHWLTIQFNSKEIFWEYLTTLVLYSMIFYNSFHAKIVCNFILDVNIVHGNTSVICQIILRILRLFSIFERISILYSLIYEVKISLKNSIKIFFRHLRTRHRIYPN